MYNIILASSSPRRRDLLEMLGLKDLRIIPAKGDEEDVSLLSPEIAVLNLSGAKAEEVSKLPEALDSIVIAADTIVYHQGKILEKPKDKSDARRMLSDLSGSTHVVYTGVTVIGEGKELQGLEKTSVFFRDISTQEIECYVETGEPMDKAGAYGIQGKGSLFAERIEGDYYNVMGLPICKLNKMLKELGVNLI